MTTASRKSEAKVLNQTVNAKDSFLNWLFDQLSFLNMLWSAAIQNCDLYTRFGILPSFIILWRTVFFKSALDKRDGR